jgi:hypothetical protein
MLLGRDFQRAIRFHGGDGAHMGRAGLGPASSQVDLLQELVHSFCSVTVKSTAKGPQPL